MVMKNLVGSLARLFESKADKRQRLVDAYFDNLPRVLGKPLRDVSLSEDNKEIKVRLYDFLTGGQDSLDEVGDAVLNANPNSSDYTVETHEQWTETDNLIIVSLTAKSPKTPEDLQMDAKRLDAELHKIYGRKHEMNAPQPALNKT